MNRCRHRTKPRGKLFVVIDEPRNSPQRMECRTCKARPGEMCVAAVSAKAQIRFHLSRWRDFHALRSLELKMEHAG